MTYGRSIKEEEARLREKAEQIKAHQQLRAEMEAEERKRRLEEGKLTDEMMQAQRDALKERILVRFLLSSCISLFLGDVVTGRKAKNRKRKSIVRAWQSRRETCKRSKPL